MKAQHSGGFGAATVRAAQQGDQDALQELLAEALPLVYNIVGCALQQHADVDDVVQETMVRAVRSLGDLRDPGAFRSWLVAVAIRQVRDLQRARQAAIARTSPLSDAETVPDPAADFAELTVLRLGLSGQRREVAEASAWLDSGNRELLALWWLEEAGQLERGDLARSLGVPTNQAAVRIQRMKQQLTASRVVVRALKEPARCGEFSALARQWDGTRTPLWRKRLIGHTKQCAICGEQSRDLIPAEKLLAGLPLVAAPAVLVATALRSAPAAAGTSASAHAALGATTKAKVLGFLSTKAVIAAVAAGSVVAVAAVAVATTGSTARPPVVAASSTSPTSPTSPLVSPSPATPTPAVATPAKSPSPAAPPPPTAKPSTAQPAHQNPKKGVAAWSAPGFDQALTASKAAWYYDWSPTRLDHLSGPRPEFVPMIWGAKNVDATTLAKAKSQGTALLTFNEPDMAAQSNMTVDQALDLWPQLQATGLRLGSPAVAVGAATPGGWLDRFMTGAAARGYRVDFITVHWYGSDFRPGPAADQLSSYLRAIHDRYHLPIWVTEYALIKFSDGTQYPAPDQQAAFVTGSATMLDSLPYVERFAWFGLAASGAETGTALFQGNLPTAMGTAFANS